MSNLADIEGFSQYKKDTANGGVVNTDTRSFENYKMTRMVAMQRFSEHQHTQETVTHLQDEINSIKSDIGDIKDILLKILEKGK